MNKFSILLLISIPAVVLAHSWIACTKFEGDIFQDGFYDQSKCRGFARNWANDVGGRPFGVDSTQVNTFDFRGGRNPQQPVCKGFKGQGYPGNFPAATYRQGERVRLIWPAKNHGGFASGRGCTDNHPDILDFVFAYCGDQRDPTFRELDFGRSPNRIADLKANGRGFKNCVNFCSDTDKAACQGDFVVPNNLNGRCTFVWLWELNQGEFYTTCWEADVVGAGAALPAPAPGPAPAPQNPAPSGGGRFIRLHRSPNPIPANGGFDVEVQWALPGVQGPKTVVLDILRTNNQYMGRGFQLEDRDSNTNRFHASSDFGNQFGEGEEAVLKMYVVRRDVWDRDNGNAWRQVEVEGFARVRASFGGRRGLDFEEVSVPQGFGNFGVIGASIAGVLVVAAVAIAVVAVVRSRKAKIIDASAHVQMVDSAAI